MGPTIQGTMTKIDLILLTLMEHIPTLDVEKINLLSTDRELEDETS